MMTQTQPASSRARNYYEILDVSITASQETIRTAYIRAKNTYGRDSLALYSLFDADQSKQILEQIEEAFMVLSDEEKRRRYDETHGLLSTSGFSAPLDARPRQDFASSFSNKQNSSFIEARVSESKSDYEPKPPEEEQPKPTASPLLAPLKLARTTESDPALDESIQKLENVNGAFLKSVRAYKRVTEEAMMEYIKIKRTYLTALENDDLERLPAPVFVRGFVLQYAKALGLEAERTANAYMTYYRARRPMA